MCKSKCVRHSWVVLSYHPRYHAMTGRYLGDIQFERCVACGSERSIDLETRKRLIVTAQEFSKSVL